MDKKRCFKCKKEKPLSEFSKCNRSKDKLQSKCKSCAKYYKRTKKGVIVSIYSSQIRSSKDRKMDMPKYTKLEFQEWLLNNKLFHQLHKEWVNSNYDKKLTPSVDRKDDYKSYSFCNIQLMTWGGNNEKAYRDRRNGINNKNSKAVLQFDLNDNFVKEYYSIEQASRETGVNASNICQNCRSKAHKTIGGFIWKYKI